MNKVYNKAPLPFQGQKRNQVKNMREILKEFPDDALYLDVFGGSGLLSQLIKQEKPKARVIYNDFDNYTERLLHIDDTNELLAKIYEILRLYPRSRKISNDDKYKILNIIKNFDGYKDYLTLSSHLLFSGGYVLNYNELAKKPFFKPKSTIHPVYNAEDYLKGVKIVKKDGFELLKEYENKDCVLVLDPPYLQTKTEGYNQSFKLKDFLNLVCFIKEPYILFGSHKSDIMPFFEFANKKSNLSLTKNYKIKQSSLSTTTKGNKNMIDYVIYKANNEWVSLYGAFKNYIGSKP